MTILLRCGRFTLVGAMGMVVQLVALALFNHRMPGHYLVASAAALEGACGSNVTSRPPSMAAHTLTAGHATPTSAFPMSVLLVDPAVAPGSKVTS